MEVREVSTRLNIDLFKIKKINYKRKRIINTSYVQKDIGSDGLVWVLTMCALTFLIFYLKKV